MKKKLSRVIILLTFIILMFSTIASAKTSDPGDDEPLHRCIRTYRSVDPGDDEPLH